MITKRNTILCDNCRLFCRIYDLSIPFGYSNYENPEPLPEKHYCKKCYKKIKNDWIEDFKHGSRYGDWTKSKAEIEAAKICHLKWIGSEGVGKYGTSDWKIYCYV